MWPSPPCWAQVFIVCFVLVTSTASAGKETVHGDLRTSTTDWPSLKLRFTLKRNSLRMYDQLEFDVYANPVVSEDGLSVIYDGFVDFTRGTTLIRYMLVDGVAYSTIRSDPDQSHISSSVSQCLPATLLPPLNDVLSALNDATLISSASIEGTKIECSEGNLYEATFQGLKLAICASDASGIYVYGSDMEIEVKYLKNPVQIVAPELNAGASSACKTVVNATEVTATTTALLTGEAIAERSISFDFGTVVTLNKSKCSCMSKPRPCLFIHGLGVGYAKAELQDSLKFYWGNLSDHAPCCTEFKYMAWNSMDTGWTNETQQQIVCDLAASVTESGSLTEIADTIVVTHSMGGLILASAIASGKCTLADSSSWIALSAPMLGSMASDFTQEACAGKHTIVMKTIANLNDECPVRRGTKSLTYEGGEISSTKLNAAYRAAQEVYRTQVYAAMCSNSYVGLFSRYQPIYALTGALFPHKSSKNDGLVEFQSCAGGLPLEQFRNHYSSRFYVTHLNHADTTFYYGDGLFGSARKPVKWFECVL